MSECMPSDYDNLIEVQPPEMVLANNDHRRALTETIISLCIALFRNQQDMVTHPDLRTAEEIYTWCL